MRKWTVYLIALATLAIVAQPALAAKNGGGKGNSGASTAESSIVPNQSDLGLGTVVTFNWNAVGISGKEWPMISVSCSQGSTVVWARLANPDAEFKLGGDSSSWREVGGSADCVAALRAYDSGRTLATYPFTAHDSIV